MRFAINSVLFLSFAPAVLLAGCGGGGGGGGSSDPDTTPTAFAFVDQTGAAAGSTITSAPVTITGIDAAATVTIAGAGGTYSVGCTAAYVSTAGTIANGQTVCVRHTSAATPGTAMN